MNEDGNVCVNEDQDSTIQYMCGGLCVCAHLGGTFAVCVTYAFDLPEEGRIVSG